MGGRTAWILALLPSLIFQMVFCGFSLEVRPHEGISLHPDLFSTDEDETTPAVADPSASRIEIDLSFLDELPPLPGIGADDSPSIGFLSPAILPLAALPTPSAFVLYPEIGSPPIPSTVLPRLRSIVLLV